jgi:GntR family transcriptional regulator
MTGTLNNETPLFLQIKQRIEDMVISGALKPLEQIPSSTQMVKFYQVNHLTVLKGITLLVEEGIVFKKRGVGMFVHAEARELLLKKRRDQLVDQYVVPLLEEAGKLGITREELDAMMSIAAEKEIRGEK